MAIKKVFITLFILLFTHSAAYAALTPDTTIRDSNSSENNQTSNTNSTSSDTSSENSKEPFGVKLGGGGDTTISLVKTKNCKEKYTTGILKGIPCNEPIDSLDEAVIVVRNVINSLLLPIVGTIFLIMFIFGGIRYITSAGVPQRAEAAKKILTAAIIGLIITVLAYVIVGLTASILGGGIA